ncbi:MAG: hypothetical protein ACOWWO_18105 [Peptococcaceae bacterium]
MSKNQNKKRENSLFWRIAITLVGVALIWIAVSNLALYVFGETAAADVATRRVGGAGDGRPVNQRYEWSIDYTFRDKNGEEHSGHTTRRGSDISVKADSRVYYFPGAPFISTLESEARPNIGQPLFVVLGGFLIAVMNRRKKKRPAPAARTAQELTDYDDSVEEQFHEQEE